MLSNTKSNVEYLNYWYDVMTLHSNSFKTLWKDILRESENNRVNPDLLFGIIVIETMNRGGVYSSIETLISYLFPSLVVKLDLSIGVGQIKPSTLKREIGLEILPTVIIRLLKIKDSIHFVGKLLSQYCLFLKFDSRNLSDTSFEPKLTALVKKYTTGDYSCVDHPWIVIYSKLLELFCKNGVLSRSKIPPSVPSTSLQKGGIATGRRMGRTCVLQITARI